MKIYLDDIRTPVDETFTVVRSFYDFRKIVSDNFHDITLISLDHDLGQSATQEYFNNTKTNYIINYDNILEPTGFDAAKWLVNYAIENNVELPLILTHSANPVGSANIMGYINNYLKNIKKPQTCIRTRYDIK